MTIALSPPFTHAIRDAAHPLVGAPEDFDPLMARVGDARFVLIGEASGNGASCPRRIRPRCNAR